MAKLPVLHKSARGRGAPPGSGLMYSEAVAEEICERVGDGETLTAVCKFDRDGNERPYKSFPRYSTVNGWCDPNRPDVHQPDFEIKFAQARLDGQRHQLESCYDIANTPEMGVEETVTHDEKNGTSIRRVRKDMLGHRTLKIETTLKVLSRMDPQRWAERLQQIPKGDDDGNTGEAGDRLIIEGGLPDPEPEPPAPEQTDPTGAN